MMRKVLKSWRDHISVNSKKTIFLLLLLFSFSITQAQIVINEVKETGSVELKNIGSTTMFLVIDD